MSRKSKELSDEMQQCASILKYLQSRPDCDPFLIPVDWKALELPDYPEIVKNPMDLETIEKKLYGGKYANAEKFAEDVRLVWSNAKLYNRSDSSIHQTAEALSKIFEKRYTKVKSQYSKKRKRGGSNKGGDKEVTRQDRVKFSQLVNQLSSDELGQLVNMISKKCPKALNEEDDDELEIEINSIDGPTLLDLNNFAQGCVNKQGKKKSKR